MLAAIRRRGAYLRLLCEDGEGVRFLLSFPFFSRFFIRFSARFEPVEEALFGDVNFLSGPSVARESEHTDKNCRQATRPIELPPQSSQKCLD